MIALVYSSVGFGGGSSYLALLALASVQFEVIRPTALLCNIIVVTSGTWIFYKENLLDIKKGWPFIVISVPMAFLGGYWPIKENTFFIILAIALIVAAVVLWIQDSILEKDEQRQNNLAVGLGVDAELPVDAPDVGEALVGRRVEAQRPVQRRIRRAQRP